MKNKKTNIKFIEDKINAVNKQIDSFQLKMEKFPKEINDEFRSIVSNLKTKKKELEIQLEKATEVRDGVYHDLEIGVHMAWKDLCRAYDNAKERFEKEAS